MDDLISRQAAIATANKMFEVCDTNDISDYHNLMVSALGDLTPAQPDFDDFIMELEDDAITDEDREFVEMVRYAVKAYRRANNAL